MNQTGSSVASRKYFTKASLVIPSPLMREGWGGGGKIIWDSHALRKESSSPQPPPAG